MIDVVAGGSVRRCRIWWMLLQEVPWASEEYDWCCCRRFREAVQNMMDVVGSVRRCRIWWMLLQEVPWGGAEYDGCCCRRFRELLKNMIDVVAGGSVSAAEYDGCCCRRFREALKDMIGYYPSYFFVACWAVITPAICAGVFLFKVIANDEITKIMYVCTTEVNRYYRRGDPCNK
jgi:hypothetical protein